MEEVLVIIAEHARQQGFQRVRRVTLSIGALSGVEADCLRFCFEPVMAGSLAQGAELELRLVPGAGWCAACARTVAMESRFDPCPHCGQAALAVTAGTELWVQSLEVE